MSFAKEVYDKFHAIDVSGMVEKKQGFSYLSWSHAHHILMTHYPESEYEHCNSVRYDDGTMAVTVQVTVKDGERMIARAETLPVLNGNKPITNPNSFHINTAVKRCFVKALALHGLGLSIYAGEDMPLYSDEENQEGIVALLELASDEDKAKFYKACGVSEDEFSPDKVPPVKLKPAHKWLSERVAA
jgi:hypothetical protein